jgi:hypothetical protein
MSTCSGPTVKEDREYLLRLIVTTFVARMTFVVFAQKKSNCTTDNLAGRRRARASYQASYQDIALAMS